MQQPDSHIQEATTCRNDTKARVIAFYLPQFHPIAENDRYWGKGFTEWVNVAKAKPLFKGHIQPRIPADLGFYDLRMPEVRAEQARLAREAGIEGFCYWHYWFGAGKELLERPFNEVVDSGEPDFPFCLGWANHDWTTKTWLTGGRFRNEMIAKQTYPGEEDFKLHFERYRKAFADPRYIRVNGKLLFLVFAPEDMPDTEAWMECWQRLAAEAGLGGFHFVGICDNCSLTRTGQVSLPTRSQVDEQARNLYSALLRKGYHRVNGRGDNRVNVLKYGPLRYYMRRLLQKLGVKMTVKVHYRDVIRNCFSPADADPSVYPTICPQYDRSPRAGARTNGLWYGTTPELWRKHVADALELVKNRPEEERVIFLKSWNEWGETNYMEPDLLYGHTLLDALRDTIKK